jgi:hypothetical protein
MVVFGFGSYRLAKVYIRGICSAGQRRRHLVPARMRIVCRGRAVTAQGMIITGGSGTAVDPARNVAE